MEDVRWYRGEGDEVTWRLRWREAGGGGGERYTKNTTLRWCSYRCGLSGCSDEKTG